MKRAFAGVILTVLGSSLLPGQSTATKPAFEIADVHVTAPGTTARGGGFSPGGRFEMRGATMLDLISMAYGVDSDMVLGGPAWLNTDRFDVIAKAPAAAASQDNMGAMLQELLADRFKLVIRLEHKELPVYALLVGKKGAKLQPAAKPGEAAHARVEGTPGLNHRACNGCTMGMLALLLPQIARNFVDHPVIDMTGLTDSYDIQLDWMAKAQYLAAKANAAEGMPPIGMFDAVEKLGLKLEPRKAPMPVLVVESVNQKPTANLPGVTKKIPDLPTEFEVAEVRPTKPGGTEGEGGMKNGRLDLQGGTLKELISLAYEVEESNITGPKWLDTDHFDVIAKASAMTTMDTFRAMLRTLIVQRFKLQTHTEDQPVPVVALAVGKRGPKLKDADGSARSECKLSVGERGRTYTCHNTTMAQLAERLPSVAGSYITHPLVDLTELKGAYDFDFTWTPRGRLPKAGAKDGDAALGAVQASTPAGDITLFEAVDKQLGLKLEQQKHPMPVIVVDHADRIPSEQ